MALHLVTGRANVGKTGVLHGAVLQAARAGDRAVVLLPTFAEVERARSEFADRQIIGVEVQELDTWVEREWSLRGDGRRIVAPVVRHTLAAAAAAHATGTIAPLAGSRGLGTLLAELVSRMSGVPERGKVLGSDADLFALADDYFVRLEAEGLIELGEAMRLLVAEKGLSEATIAINRFTDISAAQELLLVGLASANEVHLSLTWEEGSPSTEALDPLVDRLKGVCAEHRHLPSGIGDTELERLEAGLFDPGPQPIVAGGAVTLAEAAGTEAEASLTADVVADIIASGIAPHDIAVVFRELPQRARLVEAALADRGVESAVDMAVPFERSGVGVALKGLLSVAADAGTRSDMMAYLHSPFCSADRSSIEALDAECRRRRSVEGATILKTATNLLPSIKPVVDQAKTLVKEPVRDSVKTWRALIGSFMEAAARDEISPVDRAIGARACRKVMEAVESVALLSEPVDAMSLLGSLASVVVSSGGRERDGAVYVTGVHRMRARRFEAVVLGGLTASEFSSEAAEPLLVSVLRRAGMPSGQDETLSERMLFYSVVTRARRRLALVRQSSDSVGRELRPSVFWDEVLDTYRTPQQVLDDEPGGLSVSRWLPLSRLAEAAPVFNPGRRRLREEVAHSGAAASKPQRGTLAAGTPSPRPDDEYSVTELEAYHSCPYRWFYDRVVGPRALDEAFDARNRGTFCHRLMAGFYSRFREEIGARVTSRNVDAALELLERVADQVEAGAAVGPVGLIEELDVACAKDWARSTVTQDSLLFDGFAPAAEERRFGSIVDVPTSFGGIKVKGSMDRVDVGPAGLIVTDYKSSTSVRGQGSFPTYGIFQAVVYAEAAETLYQMPVVASVYRSLPTGAIRGFWNAELAPSCLHRNDTVDAEALASLKSWAADAVAAAAEGIRAGDISPRPFKDACKWCGARPFCGEAR